MNRRNIIIVLTVLTLILFSTAVIIVARGYQLDIKNVTLAPTGILVATSDPDGAEVLVNGKLTTATNNTINLTPGKYLVKIQKDGFTPWEKNITIKPEEVFKTNAMLFPSLPDLRPLTLTGAKNPTPSADGGRIAYTIASASAEKNGLWILDMSRSSLPAGLFAGADFRQIASTNFETYTWSPDGKEIVASTSAQAPYLLETDRINPSPESMTTVDLAQTRVTWEQLANSRSKAQTIKLPSALFLTLASSSARLQFSPDETKVLYQATSSAVIPPVLTTYLPGTNPTAETRQTTPGQLYVYDIKEDKNYPISNCPHCTWFPSSRHLLSFSDREIAVREFDGTNKATVYAGPFRNGFVFPWPDSRKIVILTSLNDPTFGENLYTINLR